MLKILFTVCILHHTSFSEFSVAVLHMLWCLYSCEIITSSGFTIFYSEFNIVSFRKNKSINFIEFYVLLSTFSVYYLRNTLTYFTLIHMSWDWVGDMMLKCIYLNRKLALSCKSLINIQYRLSNSLIAFLIWRLFQRSSPWKY